MLDHLYVYALLAVSILCALAGLQHLAMEPPDAKRRTHRLFAIFAISTALQNLALAVELMSTTVPGFLLFLRLNLTFVTVTTVVILWFFSEYTQVKNRAALIGLSALGAAMILVNWIQPYTMQYSSVADISYMNLPWGEVVPFLKGVPSQLQLGRNIILFLVIFFTFYALVTAYKRTRNRSFQAMMFVMGFLVISYVQGSLIRWGIIHSLPISPFCFLAMVFVMGYELKVDSMGDKMGFQGGRVVRNLILIFSFMAVGFAIVGWFVMDKFERKFQGEAEKQISSIADLKAGELELWYKERKGDGLVFFRNAAIANLSRRVLEKPADAEARTQLQMWFDKYVESYQQYDQITLLDKRGAGKFSAGTSKDPVDPLVSQRAVEVMKDGQVAFQDLYRDGKGNIHLGVLVPIQATASRRQSLGAVFMRIDPTRYLFTALEEWPIPTKTAEMMMARLEGKDALVLNELRSLKDTALKLRVPMDHTDRPIVQALLGKNGVMEGINYKGKRVIAALRGIPGLPWSLAAQIDSDEIQLPVREKSWQVIFLLLILLFAAGIGGGFIWREQQTKYYKDKAESEGRFRKIFENVQDVFYQVNMDGKIIEASPSILRFSGYTREEVIGMTFRDFYDDPNDRAVFLRKIEERGEVTDYELRMRTRTRRLVHASINAHFMLDEKGNPIGIEGSIRDITEKKEAESALVKNQESMRQMEKMNAIGRLAGGVAHDFNNLLSVIGGNVEFMLESAKEKTQSEELSEIQKAVQQGAELTKQLLVFGRKQVSQPQAVSLKKISQEMTKMFKRLIDPTIELSVTADKEDRTILADPGQMQQVILNLVLNARDAMPKGGELTVEVRNVKIDETTQGSESYIIAGDYVRLIVRDTGMGMPPEVQKHIFEPFFSTKADKGTGLGLATVYGIVKNWNGNIEVHSVPGVGTNFTLTFPIFEGVETDKAKAKPESLDLVGRETVLVAEDEEAVRKILVRVLERHGYTVLQAGDGEEALQKAEEYYGKIDLLITDTVMPKMNGKELTDNLLKSRPHIKVIFISGYTQEILSQQGILDSRIHLIQKPFELDHLLGQMRKVLNAG